MKKLRRLATALYLLWSISMELLMSKSWELIYLFLKFTIKWPKQTNTYKVSQKQFMFYLLLRMSQNYVYFYEEENI